MKDSKLLVAVKKLPSDRMKHPASEPAWWMPSSRSFLGQAEGDRVAEYLNCLPRASAKRHPFRRSLSILKKFAQASRNHDRAVIDRLRKAGGDANIAFNSLIAAAMPKRLDLLRVNVHKDGLLLQPATPEGEAAVALLLLVQKARTDRIRQCRRCRTWFYARFKHQQFCSDPEKKCQWGHYHSSEWRKKNRERNKKHQRDYRIRNPSRRSRTRLAELTRIADPL
jgi:hypothetical protein